MFGLLGRVNRTARRLGVPFDPATPIGPPTPSLASWASWASWAHYGVMVPGLPEPHRTFGVMAVVGTPGVRIFANDDAILTTPRDTASLVSATAAMNGEQFSTYSIQKDCEFAADGSRLRFGDDLLIEGRYPSFRVRRHHHDVDVDLHLTATDKVTYFADLVGGLYTHWSLLCQYSGTIGDTEASGLCTFEYARGVGVHSLPVPGTPNIPLTFFSYQVLNIDDATQALLTQVLGPRGVRLRAVYVRGLHDYSAEYTHRVRFNVDSYAPQRLSTPSGKDMRVPLTFRWSVPDTAGAELLDLHCESNNDWAYGLGAGFVGSYQYRGHFRGRTVTGTGYIEYVDLR